MLSHAESERGALHRFLLQRYVGAPAELKDEYLVRVRLIEISARMPPPKFALLQQLARTHAQNHHFKTLLHNIR
jgi:hypothetical protein